MLNCQTNSLRDDLVAAMYEKMRPVVIRYVCKRLGNALLAEAEDICQEVFMQILLYDKEITADTLPRLVYTMARNHVVDYFRHHSRTLAAQDFFFRNTARARCATEEQVALAEVEQLEQSVVEKMPRRKAAVYLLYVHFGRSVEEISSSLNISRRTVENQIFRARQDVRAAIGNANIYSNVS